MPLITASRVLFGLEVLSLVFPPIPPRRIWQGGEPPLLTKVRNQVSDPDPELLPLVSPPSPHAAFGKGKGLHPYTHILKTNR